MPHPAQEYRSKEYHAWVRMYHRCHNEDYDGWADYGGRGIYVCVRWRESYDAFLSDMGRAPTPAHSIERMDNDGGYSCGRPECPDCKARKISQSNCRWATKREQANNRRSNVRISYRGKSLTMAEWARFLGISRKCLWKRLQLAEKHPGEWPLSRILSPWPPATEDLRAAA